MKPITIYVSEKTYSHYRAEAKRRNVKTSVLIRQAMDSYYIETLTKKKTLSDWQPLDLGRIKQDWKNQDFRQEMLDEGYSV